MSEFEIRPFNKGQELSPAHTDELTGLPNRAWLNEYLPHMVSRPEGFGLHFIDLDRLKEINDTQGHAAGDALIKRAGETLSVLGTAVRLSGDEFVLLTKSNTQAGLEYSAREAQAMLAENNAAGSIGSALHEGKEDASVLLKNADTAMYADKMRRKLEFYTPEQQAVIQLIGELATKADIRLRDVPSMLDAIKSTGS